MHSSESVRLFRGCSECPLFWRKECVCLLVIAVWLFLVDWHIARKFSSGDHRGSDLSGLALSTLEIVRLVTGKNVIGPPI